MEERKKRLEERKRKRKEDRRNEFYRMKEEDAQRIHEEQLKKGEGYKTRQLQSLIYCKWHHYVVNMSIKWFPKKLK